jgi:hypothetical protein
MAKSLYNDPLISKLKLVHIPIILEWGSISSIVIPSKHEPKGIVEQACVARVNNARMTTETPSLVYAPVIADCGLNVSPQ